MTAALFAIEEDGGLSPGADGCSDCFDFTAAPDPEGELSNVML